MTQTGSPSRQRRASPSLSNELSLEAYQTENFDRPIEETLFCLQIARFARNFLKKIPMLSNLTILLWNGDGLWVDQEEESVSKTDQYRANIEHTCKVVLNNFLLPRLSTSTSLEKRRCCEMWKVFVLNCFCRCLSSCLFKAWPRAKSGDNPYRGRRQKFAKKVGSSMHPLWKSFQDRTGRDTTSNSWPEAMTKNLILSINAALH